MHRAIHQQATLIEIRQPRLQRCGESRDQAAANDDEFSSGQTPWQWVALLVANVVGGGLLLAGMFFLPHLMRFLLAGH